MTRTLLLRLAWKEYRAIRAFWISLLGLVALAELGVVTFGIPGISRIDLVYTIALAAPAFFALGCAGTAFSMEREEGTYEQLRAAPVEAWQLLVSKLGVAILATSAMFAVAWPIALVASSRTLPQAATLNGMVEMWLAAAVEAIAWGTFFSLLSARPLISVLLALFVSSTTAHLSSWMIGSGAQAFEAKYYVQAVPLRLLIAGSVLAIDIYLGLRWLDEHDEKRHWLASRVRRKLPKARLRDGQESLSLPRQPDRSAAVGHLMWQQWRQSRGAMLLLVIAQLLFQVFIFFIGQPNDYLAPFAIAPFWGAIGGALAFRPDQERNHFRFFIEHNVSPRWVWFTRQVPWLLALLATALLQLVVIGAVLLLRGRGLQALQYGQGYQPGPLLLAVPITWLVGYAVGQWTSMFLKSGLMAGFLALVLTGVLIWWSAVTTAMGFSGTWTVLPIVVAFVASTWLRSPDWIAENTTWRARIQAAAAMLVPTIAILIAVAAYRAFEIPLVDPGFDPGAYLAEITPESRKTAEMYRRANDKMIIEHGQDNKEVLELLLAASERPSCTLDDPRVAHDTIYLHNAERMIGLVLSSGSNLEAFGKFDEAFDRYCAALRIVSHWRSHMPTIDYNLPSMSQSLVILRSLESWAEDSRQTPERLRQALEKLQDYDRRILRSTDGIKSNYLLATYAVRDQHGARQVLDMTEKAARRLAVLPFLPWEKTRELRAQNQISHDALGRLDQIELYFKEGNHPVNLVPTAWRLGHSPMSPPFASLETGLGNQERDRTIAENLLIYQEAFEALRLRFALCAFKLEHEKWPESLEELVGPYFERLPLDPYTGRTFVYFPHGIPEPRTPLDKIELAEAQLDRNWVHTNQSGFWSAGPNLQAVPWRGLGNAENAWNIEEAHHLNSNYAIVYYVWTHPGSDHSRLPYYTALSKGRWHPLSEFKLPNR